MRRALFTSKRYFIIIKIVKPETEMLLYRPILIAHNNSEKKINLAFLPNNFFSRIIFKSSSFPTFTGYLLMSQEAAGHEGEHCRLQLCRTVRTVWQVGADSGDSSLWSVVTDCDDGQWPG